MWPCLDPLQISIILAIKGLEHPQAQTSFSSQKLQETDICWCKLIMGKPIIWLQRMLKPNILKWKSKISSSRTFYSPRFDLLPFCFHLFGPFVVARAATGRPGSRQNEGTRLNAFEPTNNPHRVLSSPFRAIFHSSPPSQSTVWFALNGHMCSLFWEVRLTRTYNQPHERWISQAAAKLCSGTFNRKRHSDRKRMIWLH